MGKGGKGTSRKKRQKMASFRNLVHIGSVYGGANFGERHDEKNIHLKPAIRPAQLPPDDRDFLGRNEQLSLLCNALEGLDGLGRLIGIHGAPGVGKTALAIRLSHELVAKFPDGQIYVNLRGSGPDPLPPERALESLLRAFDYSGDEIAKDFDDKVAQYRTLLSTKRCIVVLDNAGSESQVRPLLPGLGESAVLITSRNNLAGLTDVRRIRLGTLTVSESVVLLKNIIGVERAELEPAACHQLAELCGGLPLALRIAANKLRDRKGWTLEYYVTQLLNERNRLHLLQAGDLEVRASFSLSYNSLEEVDRLAFRRLGVSPSEGFSTDLAEGLCGSGIALSATLDRLVEASLIEPSSSPGRYQMHDLIRAYAIECLETDEGADSVASLFESLLAWYTVVASHADGRIYEGSDSHADCIFETPQAATDWLDIEYPSLVTIAEEAYRRGLYRAVVDLASYTGNFFERRLYGVAWRQMATCTLSAARKLDDKKILLDALVDFVRMSSKFPVDSDDPVALLTEAHELARDASSLGREARVLEQLGELLQRWGKNDAALVLLQRSVALAKTAKAIHQEGNSLLALGDIQIDLKLYDASKDTYNRARLCFVAQRDRHCQGNALKGLASLNLKMGSYDDALAYYKQAVHMYETVNDLHCLGMTLCAMGRIYVEIGRNPEACADYRAATESFEQISDIWCLATTLDKWGRAELEAGNYDEAVAKFSESCRNFEQAGNRYGYCRELVNLGIATEKAQSRDAACELWLRAIEIAESYGYAWGADVRLAVDSGITPSILRPLRHHE